MKTEQEFESYVAELGRKGIAKRRKRIAAISSASGVLALGLVIVTGIFLMQGLGNKTGASSGPAMDAAVNGAEGQYGENYNSDAQAPVSFCLTMRGEKNESLTLAQEEYAPLIEWMEQICELAADVEDVASEGESAVSGSIEGSHLGSMKGEDLSSDTGVEYILESANDYYSLQGNVLTTRGKTYLLSAEQLAQWQQLVEQLLTE